MNSTGSQRLTSGSIMQAPVRPAPRSGNPEALAETAFWLAAGQLLRELRQRRGWSQHNVARGADVALGVVMRCEMGESHQSLLEAWWRLASALDRDFGDFIDEAERRAVITLFHVPRLRPLHHSPVSTARPAYKAKGGPPVMEPPTPQGALQYLADEVRRWAQGRAQGADQTDRRRPTARSRAITR